MTPEARLVELGLTLPNPPAAAGSYVPVVRTGNLLYCAGTIAVLNGVVMMTYFNQLRAKGLDILTVVTEGAQRRLRPVMMTASICAFGLVPLLLATGPGSEIQRPLAIVVISGLISSTLLTLFLLPIIYKAFHKAIDPLTGEER